MGPEAPNGYIQTTENQGSEADVTLDPPGYVHRSTDNPGVGPEEPG